MKNYIHQINSLVNEIKALPTISEENQRKLDKKFRLEFNYNSNHLEGNTLTYQETDLLLFFDKTSDNPHEMREYEEMKAHDVAFKLIQEWALDKEFRLSEIHIKQLNEIILVRPFYKDALTSNGQQTRRLIEIGHYKTQPNSVLLQNGEMFHYASPLETPMKMGDLIAWFNKETEKKELHHVILAALFHYKFVLIHPFDDGNGRISRLLMNYVLLKNNLPPIIIKTAEKKDYLNALNQADVGNINAFIEYLAKQLVWSLEITKKGIKGESLDEVGDLEKKLFLLKKKLNEEEKVTVKYSVEAIRNVCITSILPLLEKWESKLEEFDVFFNLRKTRIRYDNIIQTEYSLIKNYDRFFNNIFPEIGLKSHSQNLKTILIIIDYSDLRKSNEKEKYNGGYIEIKFYTNAYEIYFLNNTQKVSKLYSQYLTKDEINLIVESIGNWFYNIIENELEI